MDDEDREDWVNNDEGLYDRFRASGKTIADWVRENRELIDACAGKVLSGEKPAHFLKYGG